MAWCCKLMVSRGVFCRCGNGRAGAASLSCCQWYSHGSRGPGAPSVKLCRSQLPLLPYLAPSHCGSLHLGHDQTVQGPAEPVLTCMCFRDRARECVSALVVHLDSGQCRPAPAFGGRRWSGAYLMVSSAPATPAPPGRPTLLPARPPAHKCRAPPPTAADQVQLITFPGSVHPPCILSFGELQSN